MVLGPRFRFSPAAEPVMELNPVQRRAREAVLAKIHQGTYAFEEVPCPCGDQGGLPLAEMDRYGVPVRTLLCERCGLLRSSPRFTAPSFRAFYATEYRPLYVGHEEPAEALFRRERWVGKKIREFLAAAGVPPPGRVYELGAGAGGILAEFQDAGAEVAGADYNEACLEHGRSRGVRNLLGGGTEVLVGRPPADLVILNHVLEHLLDLSGELTRLAAVLAPGGALYVGVPGVLRIHHKRSDFLCFLQNAHTYHFTLTTLGDALLRAAFHLVRGDESIRAVFRRGAPWESGPRPGEARRILHYLRRLEWMHRTPLKYIYCYRAEVLPVLRRLRAVIA